MNRSKKIQLWHCYNARSLRPLWTLEEMGIEYQVNMLAFPPRYKEPEFLKVNPLGTIPFFDDGMSQMTESTAICHYLVEKFPASNLGLKVDDPDYGIYLNCLYQSDSTYTFPLALILRYRMFERDENKLPIVAESYQKWFFNRIKWIEQVLIGKRYLCGNKFTIADITIGYSLYLAEIIGLGEHFSDNIKHYLIDLKARDAFQKATSIGQEYDWL